MLEMNVMCSSLYFYNLFKRMDFRHGMDFMHKIESKGYHKFLMGLFLGQFAVELPETKLENQIQNQKKEFVSISSKLAHLW